MKTMTDYEKEIAMEFAQAAKSAGYDAYLAARGTYGFYTDGKRVVSFGSASGTFSVSGNYLPNGHGTGWRIADFASPCKESLHRYITENAPRWANPQPTYTTPEQHLASYGPSSKYSKI